jgi:hypothetical protein
MNDVYEEAIKYFFQQGQKIKNVNDLIVRGSSRNIKKCTPHWSDIDVSIIVQKIDIEVYDQVRNLYEEMREEFPFKLSITLVTKLDFLSYRHHHGTKPIYYSSILQNSGTYPGKRNHLKAHNLEELKYDSFYNIVSLMHNLRAEDMRRGSDLSALQEFCCQLLKSSKHFVRNSVFIKTGQIQEQVSTKLFKSCFPGIDPTFPQKLKFFKKNWSQTIENPKELMQIREYILPILSDIYDHMVTYFSNLNYKIMTFSNSQDSSFSSNIGIDEKSVYSPEIKTSKK